MSRALRAVLVVVVSLAGALTLTPASYADKVVHRDARHDVVKFSRAVPDGEQAPHVRDPDVTRVVVAHRNHLVLIELRFADLRRHRSRLHIADLRTPGGGSYNLFAQTAPAPGEDLVVLDNGRRPLFCKRLDYRINYHRDLVRVTVPRTCLRTPRWVQVGIGVVRTYRNSVIYADDALRSSVTNNLRLTRRLYRG